MVLYNIYWIFSLFGIVKTTPSKTMTGLNIIGHNVSVLNDTINDAVDQNNNTLNLTTNGHQFGKHIIMIQIFYYFNLYYLY